MKKHKAKRTPAEQRVRRRDRKEGATAVAAHHARQALAHAERRRRNRAVKAERHRRIQIKQAYRTGANKPVFED